MQVKRIILACALSFLWHAASANIYVLFGVQGNSLVKAKTQLSAPLIFNTASVVEQFSKKATSSVGFDLGVGWQISPLFGRNVVTSNALEATLNYLPISFKGTRQEFTETNESFLGIPSPFHYKVNNYLLMANYKINFKPFFSKLSVFTKVGLGINFYQWTAYSEAYRQHAIMDTITYPDNSGISLAYDLGLGLQMPLSEKINVSLAYQYLNAGKAKSKAGLGVNTLPVPVQTLVLPKLSNDITGSQIVAQISYRF